MASNRKGPVLKWENNVAWPGKLTLTDKALYFQVFIVLFSVSQVPREGAIEQYFPLALCQATNTALYWIKLAIVYLFPLGSHMQL